MGHVFHLAWYMNGVGFGDSSRTSVPKIMASYPPPPCFSHGKRKLNIWHTQLQHGYSKLNDDLFKVNLFQTRECPCSFSRESAIHFLTQCPLYNDIRQELELSLLRVNARPDIGTLLYGDSDLPLQVNIKLFTAVQKYIQDSNRLS